MGYANLFKGINAPKTASNREFWEYVNKKASYLTYAHRVLAKEKLAELNIIF